MASPDTPISSATRVVRSIPGSSDTTVAADLALGGYARFAPVVNLPADEPAWKRLDLTVPSATGGMLFEWYAGGYDEVRPNVYTTELFGGNRNVHIGVDFLSHIVFVDTTAQRNLMPVYGPNPAPVRAGPLLLRASTAPVDVVHVHAIVDHSIIAVIFNNRTSLTVATTPGEHDGGYEVPSSHSSIKVEAWNLATANENADSQKTPKTPWLLPKIHNSPVCL